MPEPARRKWLRSLLPKGAELAARVVVPEIDKRLPPRRRPPGAVDELLFLARCDGCNDCVRACPHHSIFSLAPHVSPGAGTPVMVPESRPCHLCEGFACATACTRGALEVPETWSLGTVRVLTEQCTPYRGPECGACVGWCPEGVDALHLRRGRPEIDPEACVGCGLCIAACPTKPVALELRPL